jgi:TonB-linked SusC/RagA family outer membrane protein
MAKNIFYSFLAVFLFVNTAMAQVLTVSGKVTDENGIPVSSVTVIEKGKASSGVTTNEKGEFSISVAKGSTLVLTGVGYDSKQVVVNSSTMAVALATSVKGLSEVVVTGFGGTQIKKDLTGNIARVKGKDIEYLPTPTVDQALQGKAAGVFVNSQSGKLGQAVTVRVRGNSSISANSQPLYVLDGVPITSNSQSGYGGAMNPLVDINPNDIESIEVLKDASAGAIFGARAANGVVLITTKRGKAGRTQVTLNVQTGYAEATRRIDMLNSEQYAELILEGAKYRDDLSGTPLNDPNSWTSYVKNDVMDYFSYGQWSQDPTKTYDWQDAVFQRAPYQQADLQIRGGTDRTKFFASFQHLDQTGTIVGNNLKRSTGRLSLDQKANDWLDIGMSLNLARTWQRRLPDDNAFSNPLQAIALMPMTPFTDPNTGLPAGTPPGDVNIPLYYNPLLTVNYGKFTQTVFRTFGNAYARAKIIPGLFLNTEFGIDYLSQNEEGYFQTQTIRNQTRASRGVGSNSAAFVTNINTNNYLSYTKAFGKHRIDATAGMQYQNSLAKNNFTEGLDFPSDAYQKIASAATKSGGSSSESEFTFVSYFARANYSLMDKYLFSASIRRDGSSRFGNAKPFGNFPALSAGWILSNERFMSGFNFLSFLKLRASWGLVGNAEIGNFPARTLIAGDAGYTGTPGLRPSQLGNADLGWETTEQIDVGIDFGLFKNRITGEIDYYKKDTRDLLLGVNIPATSGFGSVTRNLGQLTNEGFEFVLNTQNTVGAFKWSTSLNAARNINTVTNISGQIIEGGVSSMNRVVEGAAIGVFFTPEYAGVDPANGNALFYRNTTKADGTFDRSTTSNYAEAQRVVVGNPNPDWIWGITNNFSYKGFDLSVFFNGVTGNQVNIYGMGRYSSASMLYEDNNTADQLRRWQKPGDVTDVPQVRLYRVNGSQASSRYIVNGDYIRLRTASLGYTFNSNWLRKAKIEKLRVYVQAFNLLTFTDYPYWDPEVNADSFDSNIAKGNDFYTPPQPRTILFGINLNF